MQHSLLFVSTLALLVCTHRAHRVHDGVEDLGQIQTEKLNGRTTVLADYGFNRWKKQDNNAEDIKTYVERVLAKIPEGRGKTIANLPGYWNLKEFADYKSFVDYIILHLAQEEQPPAEAAWHSCKMEGPAGSFLSASQPTQSCVLCKGAFFNALFTQLMPMPFEFTPSDNGRMCWCSLTERDPGEPANMGFPIGNEPCNKGFCWKVYASLYNAKHDDKRLKVDNLNNWKTDCPKCPSGEDSCEQGVHVHGKGVFLSPEQLTDLKDKADRGDQSAKNELNAIRSAGVVFTVPEDDSQEGELKPSDRAEEAVVTKEEKRLNDECLKRGITPCSQEALDQAIEAEFKSEVKAATLADACQRHGLEDSCEADDLAKLLGLCVAAGLPEAKCTYDELDGVLKAEVSEARQEELQVDDIIDAAVKEGSEVECLKYGLPKDCDILEREMHRQIRKAYPAWPKQKPTCKDEETLENELSNECRKCLFGGRCRRKAHCMSKCPRTCDSKYGEQRGQSDCHNAIERVQEKCQRKLNKDQKSGCFGGNNGQNHPDVAVLLGVATWITVPDLCDASGPAGEADNSDNSFFEEPWEERKFRKEDVPDPIPDGMTKCEFVSR